MIKLEATPKLHLHSGPDTNLRNIRGITPFETYITGNKSV